MENCYLIAGLGNPGAKYAGTRHNAGFDLVERLAKQWRGDWRMEKKFQARVARVERDGRTILLAQPQTYMNASGEALAAVTSFYRVATERLLVAVDDADLPMGHIRLRGSGSSGGHHGLESIEAHLATREFARLRIGIGRTADGVREITGYVLAPFAGAELDLMETVYSTAGRQVERWLDAGIGVAMSQFNGAVKAPGTKGN